MKFLSLLLVFCFTTNVFAGSVKELEREFNEYQYTMTVEWDQRDSSFQERETSAFFEKVESMIQRDGITKSDIEAFASKKMTNPAAVAALKAKLALIPANASPSELARTLQEQSKDLYANGANWLGIPDTALWIGAAVLVVGFLVWFELNYECVATDQRWECNSTTTGNSSHSSCGWVTYCTAYQKKN